ncbi:hypothetical protein CNMCM5623_000170 [Aspergillus felis]|uniref:DUF6603 domain-containing protein n=1 Tax=Aspergillus felis TaxID=1287682 RepID=A0A8H6Q3Y3_9EURO|nr:hypothetical protein CNMCM5623_000170 [Aspergillus felis]
MTAFCNPTNGIQWIVPKNDAYWFAAGIDALVFDMIGVSLILILADFSTLHLFAAATAILPPESDPNKDHPFLWVELGIISTEDLKTSNVISYGLSSTPALLCAERLKISWKFDSCLSIYGEAYCAATPKSRQTGGLPKACFNAGPLGAHFDAWADFLINVDPFYFSGAVGVSVGVDFTLDLWACTILISCSIEADVYIHGPPFRVTSMSTSGSLDLISGFGRGETTSDPLTFEQFWNMLTQGAGGKDPSKSDGPSNVKLLHTVQNGMVASKAKAKTERGGPWFVRGGTFTFRVESRFGVTRITCGTASITSKEDHVKAHDAFAKPLHVSTAVQSELDITIKGLFDGVFRLTAIVKDVPRAIWNPYDPAKDPVASHNNRIAELMNGNDPTVKALLGTSVTVPKPTIGDDGIPTCNAIDAMKEDINWDLPNQGSGSGDPVLAVTLPVQAHWAPQRLSLILLGSLYYPITFIPI